MLDGIGNPGRNGGETMRLIDADNAIEQIDDIFSVANGTEWLPLGLTKALVREMLENENITPTVEVTGDD
jgi:hypothetical protein